MDQENSFVEEKNENNLKDEKLKKIFVILAALALMSGIYYYTGLSNNKTAKTPLETVQPVNKNLPEKTQLKKELTKLEIKEINANKQAKGDNLSKNPEQKVVNKQEPAKKSSPDKIKKIKPTNKAAVIKYALLAAGKPDPFTGSGTKLASSEEIKSFLPKYLNRNSISTTNSLRELPNINSLPNINLPNANLNSNPYGAAFYEPEIKGFIGNKVIISINGISESLNINESFQGIKVVKVDPVNMSVKFIQNKKVITKNIKSTN